MTAHFARIARQDLAETLNFYEQCRRGSSGGFIDDVDHTLTYLSQFPFSGRGIGLGVRVLPVGLFPHILIYQPKGDEIFILAISDKQSPPQFWLNRASK